jgi:hypothetical protein
VRDQLIHVQDRQKSPGANAGAFLVRCGVEKTAEALLSARRADALDGRLRRHLFAHHIGHSVKDDPRQHEVKHDDLLGFDNGAARLTFHHDSHKPLARGLHTTLVASKNERPVRRDALVRKKPQPLAD